jgi:branched-chain amino acid transport system ATP-binding protein
MLNIVNLKKSFGGLMALHNVSFDVERGSITSIIGPNGAGKTTLFNVVSGIYPPDAGEVIYEGKDITGNPPHRICFMGITRTFQNLQVFENMSVLENVMVGYHALTSSEFISCMVHSFKASREERSARKQRKC